MRDNRRALSDEQERDVVRRYIAGDIIHRIAKDFAVSSPTISRIARIYNAQRPNKKSWPRQQLQENKKPQRTVMEAPPRPISSIYTPTLAEVARLKAKGLGNTAIAALLRLPYKIVESVPRPS